MTQKVLLSILGLIIFYIGVESLDINSFRCHSEFCSSIECEPITDCTGGRIVKNASFCNCCDACIKIIGENQECEEAVEGSLGDIEKSECQKGLQCVNGKCTLNANEESCLLKRHIRLKSKGIDPYNEDLWIPDCDYEGKFKPKQQKKNRVLCFDQSGERLFGQEERDTSENMTCKCSQHVKELKEDNTNVFMTKPQEHCEPSGNFQRLQCIGNLCYCANQTGGEVLGRVVHRTFIDKLPCYDEKTSNKNYLTPCEKELQRSRLLRYQFLLKGINVKTDDNLRCDPDGTFAARQCDVHRCACTDRRGTGIESYYINVEEYRKLENTMKCDCARDMVTSTSYMQFSRFKCKGYGNYDPLQCFDDDHCVCLDEEGDIISKPLLKANVNETFCLQILENLNNLDELIVTTGTPTEVTTEESSSEDYEYSDYESD